MTTTIKVITHSWPVEVTKTEKAAERDSTVTTEIVEPNSEREFYIHATRSLGFVELPEPAKAAEPVAEAPVEPAGEAA